MAFRLFIARGNSQGQQFIAVQPMVFIGRDPGCDVVLSDAGVSLKHVRITERDGRYYVEDLKSSNGTLLNGQALLAEAELSNGDSLGVGTAVVQVSVLEVPDATARKRAVPSGVPISSKRETGDYPPVPSQRSGPGDDEATLPAGRPLPREELAKLPIDRAKYEADTDKTSPLAPVMADPGMFPKIELPDPRPSLPHPSKALAQNAPTQQAKALFPVDSATAGTARELAKVPERERDTGAASSVERSAALSHELATAMAPSLPAAAEPMTAIDAAVVGDPNAAGLSTRIERVPPPLPDGHLPSVLVPASELLRRTPDAANIETRVREPTVIDESTDPSGQARPQLPGAERSAADRARRKREAFATLGGQLGWYWYELSFRTRTLIGAVGGGLVLAVLISLWLVFRPPPGPELPPEPATLTARPIPYAFGYGDGVDYEHIDFKELRFDVKSPTAAAVMVHYRAEGIGHEEVSVTVNGTEAGFVAADTGMPDRELETLLSQFALKRDEPNVLVFDNVKNPPGKERWRISELWMELIPVPEVTPEQAQAMAKELHQRAQMLEKQRAAGDDTLFLLWRTYRQGWISLLSLREERRGWLYTDMKRRADAARVELDVQCGTIMLDAKKQMELKNPEGAKEILEGVSRYFPTRDHPCPALADEKLREYDL